MLLQGMQVENNGGSYCGIVTRTIGLAPNNTIIDFFNVYNIHIDFLYSHLLLFLLFFFILDIRIKNDQMNH